MNWDKIPVLSSDKEIVMSYIPSDIILKLADEGKLPELEEMFTKGTKELFLVGGEYEVRWTPLNPSDKESFCSRVLLHGMRTGKENLVKFAKDLGAKVDNDLLCMMAAERNKKLFREIATQMGEEKIDWNEVMLNVFGDAICFFQFLIDNYLGDKWEKFLPEGEGVIYEDARVYITLLKRFSKLLLDKASEP